MRGGKSSMSRLDAGARDLAIGSTHVGSPRARQNLAFLFAFLLANLFVRCRGRPRLDPRLLGLQNWQSVIPPTKEA